MSRDMSHEKRIELSNGRAAIAAKVWPGDTNKTPILAVHGWLDNAATFDRLIPFLDNHTVYAIDLPGHGFSDHRPAGVRYHNADFIEDVFAVQQALFGEQPVIWLGHSLGAGLLMMLAGMFPERVQRLILIDGLGPISAAPEDFPAQTRATLASTKPLSPQLKAFAERETAVKARQQGMTGPLSYAAAELLCSRGLRETSAGWQWTTDRRLRWSSLMRFSEAQVLACIRAIRAPVLLVSGEQGMAAMMTAQHAMLQARIEAFTELTQVTLLGGHHLHLDENPAGCSEAINRFLRQN